MHTQHEQLDSEDPGLPDLLFSVWPAPTDVSAVAKCVWHWGLFGQHLGVGTEITIQD